MKVNLILKACIKFSINSISDDGDFYLKIMLQLTTYC